MIEVLTPGPGISCQGTGQQGLRHEGRVQGGVMDPFALHWGNRLLGNAPELPAIEVLLSGGHFRFHARARICLTGFAGPLRLAGRPISPWSTWHVQPGDRLAVRVGATGRSLLICVQGGVGTPAFGGYSFNPLATVGGLDRYLGPACHHPAAGHAPGFFPGREWHHCSAQWQAAFMASDWEVTASWSRMGVRIAGAVPSALPELSFSEPVFPGDIQCPPTGGLIVLGPDAQTTGGYPRLGTLSRRAMAALFQYSPGRRFRFRSLSERTFIDEQNF